MSEETISEELADEIRKEMLRSIDSLYTEYGDDVQRSDIEETVVNDNINQFTE